MYGLPTLQTIIALVTLPILVAMAIVNYRETWYNIMGLVFVAFADVIATVNYFAFIYEDWKRGNEPRPQKTYPNLTEVSQGTYTLTTSKPALDAEMMLAKSLIAMRNGNLDINMTEGFWVVEKPDGKNSRWVSYGGGGRNDFVATLDRWIAYGAAEKVGGQGKRVPSDWQKIRRIAEGYKC